MERSQQETAEIERHKYYLSQERGYDVGWEFAEHDWEQNFGPAFRGESIDNDCNATASVESCCSASKVASSSEATVGVASRGASVGANARVDGQHATTAAKNPSAPVGRIRRLFGRIFSSSR